MTNEVKLEHYLLELDQALYGLPVSQRAEIITEIKSHIHDSMEKDAAAAANVDVVLNKLGTPKQVAERYYVAKNMVMPRATSRPRQILKWTLITFAAFFGLIFFSGIATVWYFSPLIKVDESGRHVSLFNGRIDVDDQIGRVKIGNMTINSDEAHDSHNVDGQSDLKGSKVTKVNIPFNMAKLDVNSSNDDVLHWHCKAPKAATAKPSVNANVMTLDLAAMNIAKCTISLPAKIAAQFIGNNGKMDVQAGGQPLDITMNNGKVNIHPDSSRVYDFEVSVQNGIQDDFPHSQAKDAVKVKVNLQNGIVKQE